MQTFTLQYFDRSSPIRVTIQRPDGQKPSPDPSTATMRIQHMITGDVIQRSMTIDATPSDSVALEYAPADSDYTGATAIPAGRYYAWWIMTWGGMPAVAPSEGYDILVVQAVPPIPS